jgi:hypothetical protein
LMSLCSVLPSLCPLCIVRASTYVSVDVTIDDRANRNQGFGNMAGLLFPT